MRNIFVGIMGAALLGLAVAACTGSHAAPTAASAITSGNGIGTITTMQSDNCPGPNQCQFGMSGGGSLSGTYTGTTTATTAPNTGHHGQLTLTFDQPYSPPVTFTWSNFHKGNQAVCIITGPSFNETVSCDDGSKTFSGLQSGTYTFTDKENPQQSNDKWQTATTVVTAGGSSTASVHATWKSSGGYPTADDDPGVTYTGTLTGPLTSTLDGTLYADATSSTKCGLGGGKPPASHFHVSVSSQSASNISGSYAAQDCTIDQGTFSVSK